MIPISMPRALGELPFCNAQSPRTIRKSDISDFSVLDRSTGNGSRTFSNALRDQKDPRSIKMSFSNSRAPWAVLGVLINERGAYWR